MHSTSALVYLALSGTVQACRAYYRLRNLALAFGFTPAHILPQFPMEKYIFRTPSSVRLISGERFCRHLSAVSILDADDCSFGDCRKNRQGPHGLIRAGRRTTKSALARSCGSDAPLLPFTSWMKSLQIGKQQYSSFASPQRLRNNLCEAWPRYPGSDISPFRALNRSQEVSRANDKNPYSR